MDGPAQTLHELFLAYTAVWVLLVAYVISLGTRLSKIERQLRNGRE